MIKDLLVDQYVSICVIQMKRDLILSTSLQLYYMLNVLSFCVENCSGNCTSVHVKKVWSAILIATMVYPKWSCTIAMGHLGETMNSLCGQYYNYYACYCNQTQFPIDILSWIPLQWLWEYIVSLEIGSIKVEYPHSRKIVGMSVFRQSPCETNCIFNYFRFQTISNSMMFNFFSCKWLMMVI